MADMTLNITAAETVLENGIYYAKFTQTMNGTFAIVQSQYFHFNQENDRYSRSFFYVLIIYFFKYSRQTEFSGHSDH